jgi:hypothetical protein
MNAADLVQEHVKLDAFIESENKKFADHLKPHKKRMEEIKNLLLGMLNEQKQNSASTDYGTYYVSDIMTPKIIDREKYIDFIFDNYEDNGAMLQLREPKKEELREYIDRHNNQLPPGVSVEYFKRLNIRRV